MENKNGKYFKYAIGEILLVIIGILIALQINNWNENKKVKMYENQVYKQIYNDIISDSLNLENIINHIKFKDTFMNRILYDSVPSLTYDTLTNENQNKLRYGINIITHYNSLSNTKKGYQLFKTFNNTEIETDSLSFLIEDYYKLALKGEKYYEKTKNLSSKNINIFEQKEWFLDFALKRRLNPSYINYIKNSDEFKTLIFDYQIYAVLNYNRVLIQQQKLAEILKEKIKNRIEG